MFEIEYRNYVNNEDELYKVPILNIPKGVLMFRYVYDIPEDNKNIVDMTISSFLGINKSKKDIEKKSLCLPKHYNVFFYPCPYVMDTNKYIQKYPPKDSNMVIFETTKDVKVVLLTSPSKFYRIDKGEENPLSINCDKYTYCDNIKGFEYDPCFRENFLKQHPDVMGMYGLSKNDAKRFMKKYEKPFYSKFRKYIKIQKDIRGVSGVPELILYPLSYRYENVDFDFEKESDIYDFIQKNQDNFNYKAIDTFKHKPYQSYDELSNFMKNINKEYKFDKTWGFYISKISDKSYL